MDDWSPFSSGAATAVAEPPANAAQGVRGPSVDPSPAPAGPTARETGRLPTATRFDPFSSGAAKAAPAGAFPPFSYVTKGDPDAHWRNLYGGLEGLDQRVDKGQAAAFTSLDKISRDPAEDRARAINQTFIAERLGTPAAGLHNNWPAVKSAFAKQELGVDSATISDKSLYGWIAQRLQPAPMTPGNDPGEVKPWTWKDSFSWDAVQTARSAGAFVDSIFKPFNALTEAPKGLPDKWVWGVPGMGGLPVNPAIFGAIYNGVYKPLVDSTLSPGGIASLGVVPELEAAAASSKAASVAFKGISGLFTGMMAYGTAQAGSEIWRLHHDPTATTQDFVTAYSSAISNLAFTTMGVLATAFHGSPERVPPMLKRMDGKTPPQVAEILRQEAVTATPEGANALNRAAAHFDEIAGAPGAIGLPGQPIEESATRQVGGEKIAAAAIRTPDGQVSEGQNHADIHAEIKTPPAENPPETAEFKGWFEGSHVADSTGKPIVVYKGMYPYDWTKEPAQVPITETEIGRTTEFPAFNKGEAGVKIAGFFGDAPTANRFAEGMQGAVYPVYLSLKKPFIIEAAGRKAGIIQFGETGNEFREAIRSGQYDSVIIKDTPDEGTIYVALKPDQIRTAIGKSKLVQEGFVTNQGRFVDRVEAKAIAEEAGQMVKPPASSEGWETIPAKPNVAELSVKGDYVISHRENQFSVSYRPAGVHEPVGQFQTLAEAKAAADAHAASREGAKPQPATNPDELHSHQVEYDQPRSAFGQTSLKNAYGELERDAYGFAEAPPTEQRNMAERWARSAEVLENNPKAGEQLAARLLKNPNIGLTDDQSALLLRHKVELQRSLNAAADAMADSNSSPELKAEAGKQVNDISNQLVRLLDAVNRRGSEWGREGRWRQALAREDYSFASQETLLRAAKGGAELSDAERTGLMDKIKEIEAQAAKLQAHVDRLEAEPRETAVDRTVRAMTRPPEGAPRLVKLAESIREKLHARAAESRKFLSGKVLSPTPEDLYHLAVIGADQIYSVGLDFAQWSTAMVGELGEKVKPYLDKIWVAAQKNFHTENRAGLIADLAGRAPEDRVKALSAVTQELARNHIAQALKGRDAIVDAVWADVKEAMPDATRRDVMDAISGYGQFKPLTHDAITDQLRDVKGQLQQVAKLEDMAAGEAPKKTGMERKVPSDEERRLIQQVEAKKKEGGYEVTDPEKQLRTALQSVKRRLENQIKDLEKQIETRTKIVKEKRPIAMDAEARGLEQRRDELKAEFDLIFGRKELSDEQRLNIWKAGATRRISELQERLDNKDYEPPAKRPPVRLDEQGFKLKGELERLKQDLAIERYKVEEEGKPKWQKGMKMTSDLARAAALSGYHTLLKLATFSLARFAETPVTEAAGAILRRIPGIKPIAEKATLEMGAEYKGLAKFYGKAATRGMADALETLKTGKSTLKAELGEAKFNERPVHWYDYFGISHMAEKSPLLRGDFELRLEKELQSAIANGLDVNDPLVVGAMRKAAFDYSQRAILQENNMFSNWLNTLNSRLEAANPKTGKSDVVKVALSTFVRTFLTKGIVRTPANYIMQTLERTPLGLAKGSAQAFVAHMQGVDKLTDEEANVISRLFKLGAVGTGVFVWGMLDAAKKPQDRIFGGYYQPGDKRGPDDVGFGRIRVNGWEVPFIMTHNPLTESGQMGSTFYRVLVKRLKKQDAQDDAILAAAATTLISLASEAPIVNPITRTAGDVERGEAHKVVWDELAGLVPMLVANIAQDLDKGRSRKPGTLGEAIKVQIPGLREEVPETKAQKERDIRERLKKK